MYGSLHISESVARLSVAGVILWCSLSAGIATAVGVGAWTLGNHTGSQYTPAKVTSLQVQAYTRGYSAGYRAARGSTR
jgi:hypothetical protein